MGALHCSRSVMRPMGKGGGGSIGYQSSTAAWGPVLFMLSDEAAWLTGHVMAVDGGEITRI